MRLRICNDLLFYYDDRPGISPAFIVGYGFGLGVVGLWLWLWLWGSGVRGSVCEVAPFVVGCWWLFFVLVEGAILYPYFCGIVYALCWFTLMLLINLVLLCMVILCL